MTTPPTFVIVGGGLAGAKAAETLRTEGFDGRVVLLGEEAERPYERPPLSKDYLRGESEREKLYVHDAGFYDANDVELRTSTSVTGVDLGERQVHLGSGERLGYDRLLLATGSAPRRLEIPGADLDGVHYLRYRGDADALAGAAKEAERVVVVGSGWIGSEVAASLRQLGRDVTLVSPDPAPLVRVLGPELGEFYRSVHAGKGVRLALGTGVDAFRGSGRVDGVVTSDGRTLPCDLVLVGIGAAPRVELAEAAGLDVANGVPVDERLETRVPGVFAAGDIAAAWHPVLETRVRVEHWSNALNGGPAAARNMLGQAIPYERLPYFFSDQYDVGMEYSGLSDPADRVVFRGDPATSEFVAFWVRGRRVVAGMNVNVWDVAEAIQDLVRSKRDVDLDRLADPATPIGELAGADSGAGTAN
jgi:3-phenylpropionate/trans-cinnamate dioxygenase ferredoxin reductase subunit